MYTWEGSTFPSPFTVVHTKVAPPLSLILLPILSVSLLHTAVLAGTSDSKNPDPYYSKYYSKYRQNFEKSLGVLSDRIFMAFKAQGWDSKSYTISVFSYIRVFLLESSGQKTTKIAEF